MTDTMNIQTIERFGLEGLTDNEKTDLNGGGPLLIAGIAVNSLCAAILLGPVVAALYLGWISIE